MQVAEAFVEILKQSGVKHIFGLPGDTGTAFYDALRNEPSIQHVMTRDERSASFMADVYARLTGTIGVCEGPSGGGATYIVPGVAEAQGSAIPMLCITSDTPVSQRGRGVLTELDQRTLFTPVTKASTMADTPEAAADTLRRSIRLACSGRPGAVHLGLPADVQEQEIADDRVHGDARFGRAPSMRTRPDAMLIEVAMDVIRRAERPVIVAGGGVLISQAEGALTSFAEALGIPVATSINGKGSIAETSDVAAGVVGGNGAWRFTNDFVNDADLVILLGTRTDSTTTHHWTVPPIDGGQQTIQIDVEPREIGNNYRIEVGLQGDARLTLEDLLAAAEDHSAIRERHRSWLDRLALASAEYWAGVDRQASIHRSPVKPAVVTRALRNSLPDNAVIVADPGTPTPYLGAHYRLGVAGRTTVIPRAHGGLGYAIPGVVGAAMARPGVPVVGFTGDGSFGMSCGEMETITRLGLPVVIVHCSNGTYGWIKELQHLYHADRYFSVDFSNVAYADIARGFGFRAWTVERSEEAEATIRKALASGEPAFVTIETESQITETPPVAAWVTVEESRRSHVSSHAG